MGKVLVLTCREMGASECDFEARAESEEEILHLLAEHGVIVHKVDRIPDEIMEKARALIREQQAA